MTGMSNFSQKNKYPSPCKSVMNIEWSLRLFCALRGLLDYLPIWTLSEHEAVVWG